MLVCLVQCIQWVGLWASHMTAIDSVIVTDLLSITCDDNGGFAETSSFWVEHGRVCVDDDRDGETDATMLNLSDCDDNGGVAETGSLGLNMAEFVLGGGSPNHRTAQDRNRVTGTFVCITERERRGERGGGGRGWEGVLQYSDRVICMYWRVREGK